MKGKIKIISAMLIFGTIGVFVKKINLSSSDIAFLRALIGSLFLLITSIFMKQKYSFKAIRKNILLLVLSGAAMGVNWILLFQAYKYTTVSNATLSYYFAPIFVIVLAPLILKEKLTPVKAITVITAMAGLFLVVNIGAQSSGSMYNHSVGILYGLSAAALYASVILINKFIKNLSGFETTLIQLMVAALVLLPYVIFKEPMDLSKMSTPSMTYILILGIVHTGIAYFLYFTSIKDLKGQTIAVLSYIDPISAVVMAALFLGEKMAITQILGGFLIIGSTFISEKLEKKV